MNRTYKNILIWLMMGISSLSCGRDYMYPDYTGEETKEEIEPPTDSIGKRSTIRDLVLIYGAGTTVGDKWTDQSFVPYVSYNNGQQEEWMFDGFLFLELNDGNGNAYTTGHAPNPALKTQWEALIKNYFEAGQSIAALDERLEKAAQKISGTVPKRKVVIGIPEPMRGAVEWGEVNGKILDFSKDEHRIEGCKWFIDNVINKFAESKFKHIELEGFYWIAEEMDHTSTIMSPIGNYLKDKKMTFVWIPWWKSPGYDNGKQYGFTEVYLQPNYFFDKEPLSRLQEACIEAKTHGIDLEVEFDESVLGGNGSKLNDYLDVFEENQIYETKKLAYYQSVNTLLKLYRSVDPADKALYKRLSEIVSKRQKVENPPYLKN